MSDPAVIDDGAAAPAGAAANGTTGHGGTASSGTGVVPGVSAAVSADLHAREVTDLVTLLTERALAISSAAARQPSSVRISAGAVQVEICWPAGAPVAAFPASATGAPADAAAGAAAAVGAGQAGTGGVPGSRGGVDVQAGVFALSADTVGTFYRAPEPGAAPFVTEGDRVLAGQQVGIIEAMKLMIPVEAERPGEVVELLVADRAPVEYGQPLMLMREAGQ